MADSVHKGNDIDVEKDPNEYPNSPSVDLEHREERRLRLKVDLHTLPICVLVYLLCFLDRSNIGNAKLLNATSGNSLMQTLHLTDHQFRMALQIFFIPYSIGETFSNYFLKKFRPSRWIALIMLMWGTMTIASGAVKSYHSLLAVRFLLGAAEAGLFPGLIYYFTFWFRPEERSIRIAFLWATVALAGAFGGTIAYGVGHINKTLGLQGWRWLFILEGVPSLACSVFVFFCFPDFPETVGWLSDEERAVVLNRLQGVASTHKSQYTWQEAKVTLKDWRLYGHYVAYICVAIPINSLSLFLPTIVSGLGYSGLEAQLFTVPPYACAYLVTIVCAWVGDKYNQRSLVSICAMFISTLAFLTEAQLPDTAFKARYAILCLATTGAFAGIAPSLGWLSSNLHSTAAAGIGIGIATAFTGPGQIIGLWIYKASERPGYFTGHMVNFAVQCCGMCIYICLRWLYSSRNKKLPEGARLWAL